MIKIPKSQNGAAILLLAFALLLITSAITLFSTTIGSIEKKLIDNAYQVLTANVNAESAMQYAVATLTPESVIDRSQEIIALSVTGYSDNKKVHRTIHQEVFFQPLLKKIPTSKITLLKDHYQTISQFETGFFNTPLSRLSKKILAQTAYKTSTDINSFITQNRSNSIFVIHQHSGEAKISGNNKIGSPKKPIILIVEGNLNLSDTKIYGLVFVSRNVLLRNHANINGAIITSGTLTVVGQAKILFDRALLKTLQKTIGNYTVVPGSWRDF